MQKNNNRFNRIDEELKKEISNIIMYDIKDPNVTGLISVTKAKVTPDLKFAKVYVSILNSKDVEKTMTGLKVVEVNVHVQGVNISTVNNEGKNISKKNLQMAFIF